MTHCDSAVAHVRVSDCCDCDVDTRARRAAAPRVGASAAAKARVALFKGIVILGVAVSRSRPIRPAI
jgi:hypothetical protein